MQRPDLILAGSAGAAVALCLGVAWWMLDGAGRDAAAIADLAKAMGNLPASAAEVTALEAAAKRQGEESAKAAAALAAPLKPEYLVTDAVSAAARIGLDLKALRNRAERSNIGFPGALPFQAGLDADDAIRSLQLAHVALMRQALDGVMDAGVAQIANYTTGPAWLSPVATGAQDPLAAISADIELIASPEALATWLKGLAEGHPANLSLRKLQIEPEVVAAGARPGAKPRPEEVRRRIRATVVLLTRAQPAWRLTPEAVPAGTAPATAAPAATAAPNRGLGNKRVSP